MHETDGILMKQMNARAQLKSLEGANKAEMKGGDGRRNLSDGISNERQEAVGFDQRFLYAEEHPSYEVVQKNEAWPISASFGGHDRATPLVGRAGLTDTVKKSNELYSWGLYVCNAPSQFLEEIIRVRVKEMEGGRNGWNTDDLCAT